MRPAVHALSLVACLAVACGGSGARQDAASPAADAGDVSMRTDGSDVPDVAAETPQPTRRLEFADPTDDLGHPTAGAQSFKVFISPISPRDLRVRVLEDDVPAAGVPITFTIEGDAQDGISLAPTLVETGEDGIAIAQVQIAMQGVFLFNVRVCVDGDPVVPCLVFVVHGGEAGCCPLMVNLEPYNGLYKSQLSNAEVRLFVQNGAGKPSCSDLHLDALPAASVVSSTLASLTASACFPVLPGLQKDSIQTYAILALAKDDAGTIKAWGCAEATAEWGACVAAPITLSDIPPKLAASHLLTTTIDLQSGLDPEIANVLYAVTDVLSDPASGVLTLFCAADPGDATLADFCALLFSDPGHPSAADLTEAGEAVRTILDAGAPPAIYMDPGVTSDLLSNVRLRSKLTFACSPDDAGMLAPGCVVHTWQDLELHWTLGTSCALTDPACGWNVFTLAEVLGLAGPPQTVPDASIEDLALSLGPHEPPLAYGDIVRFAVERVLLPGVYGDGTDGLPAVDSFEDFLGAVLAGSACLADDTCCAVFADAVAAAAPGIAPEITLAACTALRAKAPTYLRSLLTSPDPVGASLQIATKAPCPFHDKNHDMKVDALGDPAAPCAWDARWTLGGLPFAPTATFFGVVP